MTIKKTALIACIIVDIMAILIMLYAPEGNLTLGKFVMGIFSLIGFNYVMLKVGNLILSL